MLLFTEPNRKRVDRFLQSQSSKPFTYPNPGATETGVYPAGFQVDRNRVLLGHGLEVWSRAVLALEAWTMFHLDWCTLFPPRPATAPATTVAVTFRHYGFWSLNAARVVYEIAEPHRRAYAYGTLPGHSESGEERFQVERSEDGAVYFDLLAFSKPRDLLVTLTKPLARRLQRRFVIESLAAMKRASNGAESR